MFDIGFWELVLLGLVGLVVLGPERLPVVARTLGRWLARARRYADNLTSELENELGTEDIRRDVRRAREEIESQAREFRSGVDSFREEAEAFRDRTESELDNFRAEAEREVEGLRSETESVFDSLNESSPTEQIAEVDETGTDAGADETDAEADVVEKTEAMTVDASEDEQGGIRR